jgi:hypothetical protein
MFASTLPFQKRNRLRNWPFIFGKAAFGGAPLDMLDWQALEVLSTGPAKNEKLAASGSALA